MKGLYIFDTEGDGLLDDITYFHCLLFKEYQKDNFHLFLNHLHPEYQDAVNYALSKGKKFTIHKMADFNTWITKEPRAIACHNIFGFDMPAFKKLLGTSYDMFKDPGCRGTINGTQVDMYDTLSMSRTLSPDRQLPFGCPQSIKNPVTGKSKKVGPHGLEAWGYRVANMKPAIEDWRGLPLWKYIDRCYEDVIINELTWTALMLEVQCKDNTEDQRFLFADKPKGNQMINWKDAMRRGLLTDYLMIEQEFQGINFDEDAARKLIVRIDQMMKECEDAVEPHLPEKELSKSQQPVFPKEAFKGDGTISSHGWNWLEYKLGYPVNRAALELVGPPKTAFKGNGEVSKAGESYCVKQGVEDPAKFADFIRSQIDLVNTLLPLPPEMMGQAIQDLRDQKMPSIMVKMRISNQDDIKKYLIRDANWLPTLWRTKDATKDSNKKQRPDAETESIVRQYIEDLAASEYKKLILKHMNLEDEKFKVTERRFDERVNNDQTREYVFKKFLRKARKLPTSPQLRDAVTKMLCPNLERVEGAMAKLIVKWLSLRNRRSVIDPIDEDKVDTGWLNHPRLKIDGKLPASYSGITNTGRRKHKIIANLPKPDEKVLLGKEMRSLLGVTEGYYQVGIDGSNLEGMIAAWGAFKFDGGEYLRIMESEDAHARNAKAYSKACGRKIGRGEGKGVTYGIMYGAQAAKIAAMLNISLEQAQAVIDAFWDSNIGLKGRREALENFWELTGKRFIYGLDGRKIWTRSKHSLLNAYQQNGGAALFDLVGILLHWQLVRRGWYDDDVRRIIYYHDEYQLQVPNKYRKTWYFDTIEETEAFLKKGKAEGRHFDGHKYKKAVLDAEGKEVKDAAGEVIYEPILSENGKIKVMYCPVGEMVVKCVEKAAQMMNSPVHITGDYLTGQNWAQCH